MHISIAKIDFRELNKTKITIAKIDFAKKLEVVPPEPEENYMYFKLADGYTIGNVSYKFEEYYNLHNKYLKYSKDGRHWKDWNKAISMLPNFKYYIKGDDDYVRNSDISSGFFTSDLSKNKFNIECGGNIMSLCNMNENITTNYCFYNLFYNMTNLLTPPELPATTLTNYCYYKMFNGCRSLNNAPELPATTLESGCYSGMFMGCSSLTQAPELPATTLAASCYYGMFSSCRSLNNAPELPAITLTRGCYGLMFYGCSSLTQAPELTATNLAEYCYDSMFYGCTSLTEITLNGDFNSSYATYWVSNVSTSGTFYNNSDLDIPVGVNGIPTGWTEIRPVKVDYMYFKLADGAESGNVSYKFDEYFNLHNKYLKISTDRNNWSDWTESISMTPNVKYFVKGDDNYVRNSSTSSGFFTSDVSQNAFNIECGGNIMSLVNMNENITTNYCFCSLFYDMRNLLTPPELPATTLADSCYYNMFYECPSLTQAPELPATTLVNSCYYQMFNGCTSLTQAPELPATTLAASCYSDMFFRCSSLTQAPALPATTLARFCYSNMFNYCSSLTQAPALPATTLENYCYQNMFSNCSSLTQAPELPATTLADSCYYNMFYECPSLTQAPELPATTLASNCYYWMFADCSSLTQAPELPATTLASNCYSNMFYSSNKLNWIKALFTTTPSTSYTDSWVNGVSAQGVFVKSIDATWTDTGSNAVPSGWTVIYFDTTEGKYYTTQTKETECDKYGNPL